MSELDFVFGIACSGWLKVQCKLRHYASDTGSTNNSSRDEQVAAKEETSSQRRLVKAMHFSCFCFQISSILSLFLTFLLYGNVKLGSFNAITIFCFPFSF